MNSGKYIWPVTVVADLAAIAGIMAAANTHLIRYMQIPHGTVLTVFGWLMTLVMIISPSGLFPPVMTQRLKILRNGLNLLILFCISTVILLIINIVMWRGGTSVPGIKDMPSLWIINTAITTVVLTIVFFAGMIRVYVSSEQLGIKWRVIGLICGFLLPVNVLLLLRIMSVVQRELRYENSRLIIQENRKDEELCRTKYPILLVHGVFFRDFKYLNYWGRIPKALEDNGAVVYYGEHQSAASVAECGRELADRIEKIAIENGYGKMNVIAHSKGGLDMRYALTKCGADKYTASLTTINTPHRGCEFADYLLNKIPKKQQDMIADKYNRAFKSLGDEKPDFLKAVNDLTHSACEKFNEEVKDVPNVVYKSVGSKLNHWTGGRFPLNMSYSLVKYFDGDNDGLVGKESFPWGSGFKYLTVRGKRGISHGDVIDLNRENIPEFDVREFYINLVNELKNEGL